MNLRFIKQTVLLVLLLPTMVLANEVDLSLSITSPPDTVGIGATVPFHFQITNNSANTATNVVFKNGSSNKNSVLEPVDKLYNPLEPDLEVSHVNMSQGTWDMVGYIFTGQVGDILPGETVNITVEMVVEFVYQLRTLASVTSDQIDSNDSDNTGEAIVDVAGENAAEFVELITEDRSYSDMPGARIYPAISADGQIVSFRSEAGLAPGAGDFPNVFTVDRSSSEIELTSKSTIDGYVNGASGVPEISADGDVVIFISEADSIVADDNNQLSDLFAHIRSTDETLRISISNDGEEANAVTTDWDISPDGRYIAFVSKASNLVADDLNSEDDIFIFDMQSRELSKLEYSHQDFISASPIRDIAISANGEHVAFTAKPNQAYDSTIFGLYLWSKDTGITQKISSEDVGIDYAGWSNISDNGKYIAYIAITDSYRGKILKYNTETETNELVTEINIFGTKSRADGGLDEAPSISNDGRFVVFSVSSGRLVEGYNNAASDIFIHDAVSNTFKVVSKGVGGFPAKGDCITPVISADGTTIAFASTARNLIKSDLWVKYGETIIYVAENPFTPAPRKPVDLSIEKLLHQDIVRAGDEVRYNILINNISADPEAVATGVVVEDILPGGLEFVSASSLGMCEERDHIITCSFGVIDVGGMEYIDIVAKGSEYGSGGEVTSTATVSSTETDYELSNNSSSATITVTPPPELRIFGGITGGTTTFYVGDRIPLAFYVDNNSSAPANAIAEINFPASLELAPGRAGYDPSTGKVTLNIYSIERDRRHKEYFTATALVAGTFEITANVTVQDQIDSNLSNNSTTVTITIEPKPPEADIAISLSDSSDPVYVGENITYKATVVNNGPDDATAVKINSLLPIGTTFVSASTGCSESAGLVTCNVGNLANGASTSVDVVVKPTAAGTITNSASVTATEDDPVTANNSAYEQTVVKAITADLSITQIDSADPVYAGNNVTYTLTVTNNGISDATSVKVVDTIPTGITFVSASAGCSEVAGEVTCNVGSLANGASTSVDVVVKPTTAGTITNSASVSATEGDPVTANNSASEQTVVKAITADLSITQVDSADPVYAGNNVTYTLTVTNNGISDATSVKVVDTIPTGVTFVSASTGCSEAAGAVTCNVGNLANGASTSVDVVIKPTAAGTITNTASVSATESDPVTANNTTSEDTVVNVVTDMVIVSALATPEPVLAGANLTYSVKIKNNAAEYNTANGVEVTYTFSGDIVLDSASGCSALGNVVTCGVGSMTYNQEKDLQLVIKPDMDGALDVNIEVSSSTDDPDTTNNDTLLTTIVDPAVDIVVGMTGSANPIQVGENLTYTITVKNTGPSTAINAVLADTLPRGVSVQSFTSSHGTCTSKATVFDCQLGDLGNDETATITLTITPTDRAAGTSVNSVTVTSDAYEADATDNTAMLSTLVNQTSVVQINLKGKGSGIVYGSGMSCPGTCEAVFTRGDTVTLTAVADDGSKFTRWQGGVCPASSTCTFTVDKAKISVSASFK